MMRVRSQRCALFCVVLVLLSLALIQAEAQTQPVTGKAKVDRLVMGLINLTETTGVRGSMAPQTT